MKIILITGASLIVAVALYFFIRWLRTPVVVDPEDRNKPHHSLFGGG